MRRHDGLQRDQLQQLAWLLPRELRWHQRLGPTCTTTGWQRLLRILPRVGWGHAEGYHSDDASDRYRRIEPEQAAAVVSPTGQGPHHRDRPEPVEQQRVSVTARGAIVGARSTAALRELVAGAAAI